MKKSNYIFSADVIRDVAIIGVVIIHTANSVFSRLDFFGGFAWWVTITLNSISRISIPLFIVLSGYLILKKNENFTTSLKRTFKRIVIPFFVWFFIYILWNGGQPSLNSLNFTVFSRIFAVNVFDLYFLVIMIGLYIVAPFLRFFLQKASPKEQNYIATTLIVLSLIDVAGQFIFGKCNSQTFFNMWIPYIGLFAAGFVLGNFKKVNKLNLSFLYILGLATTILLSYFHFLFLLQGKSFLNSPGCLTFYSDYYLSPNVVLMTLTAFLILLNLNYSWIKSLKIRWLINSVARTSFAIYLVHIIIVEFEDWHHIPGIGTGTILILSEFLFRFLFVIVISYLISLILLKIPFVKRIFGA